MLTEEIYTIVVYTGRVAAGAFVASLLAVVLKYRRPIRPLIVYFVLHLIHFGAVAWLAFLTQGAKLSVVGGWPGSLAIGAGFCALVCCAGGAWSGRGGPIVRVAGHVGVTMIALSFVATYVPLVATSKVFVFPVAMLSITLVLYLARVRQGWGPPIPGRTSQV